MSCKPGNQYAIDNFLEQTVCSELSSQNIRIKNIVSGQTLTLKSGVGAWKNEGYDIYQANPTNGSAWILESGANLYVNVFGIEPSFISGSGLPMNLGLSNFNTITGTPVQTGNYKCKLIYKYCGNTYTGVTREITIHVCTGEELVEPYVPIFFNSLGPKFNYDPVVEYSTGCFSGTALLSIISGQRLILESGVPAWFYAHSEDYSFITGNRLFTLSTGTNLYNTSSGIEPEAVSGYLPVGLAYKNYSTITGIPTGTGKWSCLVQFGYCTGSGSTPTYGKINKFILEVISPEQINYTEGAVYTAFSASNTIPYNLNKVKNINFYYNQNNQFVRYFETISGYGNIEKTQNFTENPQIFYAGIDRPTGYLPAVLYQTGLLSGVVGEGLSSFTWSDVNITGTGSEGNVYLDQITGYTKARNVIIFNTGLLVDGDILSINNINFYYRTPNNVGDSYYNFDSLSRLINVLNSGATGAFNDTDFFLQDFVGITGYIDQSTLYLDSYLLSGEDGNSVKISRNTQNLDSIQIPYRYFQSGETFRVPTSTWSGVFDTTYPTITKENSGIYFYNYIDNDFYGSISGLLWIDSFSGNYYITTGIYDTLFPLTLSGSLVPFIQSQNIYSGSFLMPSGQNAYPTGFSISIRKPNYYDISGNISKYIVSGENFIYSGLIEG
jgi:hypothetical protein